MSRLSSLLGALLAGLAFGLTACDNEQANERAQSGTWHVARVTATESRTGFTAGTVTVTDAGDFAFEDHGASFNRAVLYLDKAVPSRALQRFYVPTGTTLAPRRYDWFWEADPGPAHRLVIRFDQFMLATFTYDENTADRQTFFYLERDNQGHIGYREDWALERSH
ncbi:hypothetical protein [Hymenobacter rubidus]|uniref:hypothetical protein n=1 Tax=Hymenobacter rubidus TaxID=1441626 RepID=UPI00191F8F23|nr:hypothetical protein [Hymenobacter rubidus]